MAKSTNLILFGILLVLVGGDGIFTGAGIVTGVVGIAMTFGILPFNKDDFYDYDK
ncbi:MAG: hypothetical protein SCK29_01320 [Bacillota bacterium]|nr:hypothetical protein [Bacillota bacterium]MDW7682740.1 hypothetical protein [Bacillota bacterium]